MNTIPNMSAAAWEARYQSGDIPWDMNSPTPELTRLISEGIFTPESTVMVPGAGSGYDALALAQNNCAVSVVEFAYSACQKILSAPSPRSISVFQRDFFSLGSDAYHHERYDFVWEYTFYCAIAPDLRAAYFSMLARLLRRGGLLLGLFFPLDERSGGPPFAISKKEIEDLAAPYFSLEFREPVASIKPRAGKEILGIFTRL